VDTFYVPVLLVWDKFALLFEGRVQLLHAACRKMLEYLWRPPAHEGLSVWIASAMGGCGGVGGGTDHLHSDGTWDHNVAGS